MTSATSGVSAVPLLDLAGKVGIPQLGFGVWQVPDDDVPTAIGVALDAGYRHIDTARIYDNEAGVGRALAASPLARDEVFVTTKVWNGDQGRDKTLTAFDASMARLRLDVLDLYLIHWPVPRGDRYVETWRTLLELRESGRVRAVGVCNFGADHLQRLIDETGEVPSINQVELHPYFQQDALTQWHAEHGVITQSWSPLAQGGELLAEPTITGIAAKHAVTPGQVVIRWHLHKGYVVIPKSVTPARIRANFDVFGFDLDAEDLTAIAGLHRGTRLGPDPATFNNGA